MMRDDHLINRDSALFRFILHFNAGYMFPCIRLLPPAKTDNKNESEKLQIHNQMERA